jgi:hypothetical protein
MQKEFIPYEQALELKELGFNEPCFCFFNPKYSINDLLFGNIDGEFDNWNIQTDLISAPLYQQAFRWFREKKILAEIKAIDDWNSWGFKIFEEDCMSPFHMSYYDYDDLNQYHTYEEAELACLKKLIETIKKYKN